VSGDLPLEDLRRRVLRLGPDDPTPATISIEQAAEWLGVGRGFAYDRVKDGTIPSIKLGERRRKGHPPCPSKIRIPVARCLALLDDERVEAPDAPPPAVIPLVRRAGAGPLGEER
jgi:excisionase family DNA binding protein